MSDEMSRIARLRLTSTFSRQTCRKSLHFEVPVRSHHFLRLHIELGHKIMYYIFPQIQCIRTWTGHFSRLVSHPFLCSPSVRMRKIGKSPRDVKVILLLAKESGMHPAQGDVKVRRPTGGFLFGQGGGYVPV
jgi:hypothetical protein